MKRRRFLIGLGAAAASVTALALGLDSILTSPTSSPLSGPRTLEYTIAQSGNIITATLAHSDLPPIVGTDAATVIMRACVPNAKVLIKAGTYIIRRQYGTPIGNSGVELYGEPGTILKLGDGMNTVVLHAPQVSNVNIHDLEIDGNRMNQSQTGGSPAINGTGISAYQATNLTIQNCYVHDCRDFGINAAGCTNLKIVNNLVKNSDANGINVGNQPSDGGSGSYIAGNVVDGASDVGITAWEAINLRGENNTVRNVNMTRSPWGWQSNVGLMVENSGNNVTYRNNTVDTCGGSGMAVSGGTNVLFDGNTVTNCGRGFYAYGGDQLTVTNCTFDRIALTKLIRSINGALDIDPQTGTATITGCNFTNIGPYLQGGSVIQLLSPSGKFTNNVVHTNSGKYQAISTASSGWAIANNTILP